MKVKKTLILPECYNEVHTGGPYKVVHNMYKSDFKKRFNFIHKDTTLYKLSDNSIYFPYNNGFFQSITIMYKILGIIIKYRNIIKSSDQIICHDIFFSFAIHLIKKNVPQICVYHGQNTIYNEYINLLGVKHNFILKLFLNFIEKKVILKTDMLGFPSKGAYENFKNNTENKNTITILEEKYRKNKIKILYNGVTSKDAITYPDNVSIQDGKIIFSSVSSLNNEKGVDRIPSLINYLLNKGIKLQWIVIGSGKLEGTLKKSIEKYNLTEHVIFKTEQFKKSDIQGIFMQSNYYLMLHRISIFDYTTIEAMGKGAIPILSNTGGNKELISDNGLLISEKDIQKGNYEKVYDFIQKKENLSGKNKVIVKNIFNEENFINNYYNVFS